MTTNQLKETLRQTCIQIRNKLTTEYQSEASARISQHIFSLQRYQIAKQIALYSAFNKEVDLTLLKNHAKQENKHCYFPALAPNKTLTFLRATDETPLVKNCFGILEPAPSHQQPIALDNLDIIFLPLVAFDDYGTRLGMGAGYYDRCLANNHTAFLVGVAYEFQHQIKIPRERWDVPMDVVITEQAIHWMK